MFIYVLCVTAWVSQHSWQVSTETIWLIKAEIFTIWAFIEMLYINKYSSEP